MSDDRTLSRRVFPEGFIVRQLLGDFQVEGSLGQHLIDQFDDSNKLWTHTGLLSLATACSELCNVRFPRAFKRNRALIYKWLSDNYLEIEPLAAIVTVA
jgi:hypothetical protein